MLVFPQLNTSRLKLRKLEVDDFPALVKYANNKKIADYVLNIPHPYQESNAVFRISYVVQGFNARTRFVFAIILLERAELIGEISLHLDPANPIAELGYWVGEPFWGQGIATEAIAAILKFGFERLDLSLIYATCHMDNKASEKVLVNNGMTLHNVDGNVGQYRLTKQAYAESHAHSL